MIASAVQSVGMNIDFKSLGISENEITFPTVVARLLSIAASAEQFANPRNEFVRQGNVKVGVCARLLAEESIHSPAAVDVHLNAVLLKELYQIRSGAGVHERSLANLFLQSRRQGEMTEEEGGQK